MAVLYHIAFQQRTARRDALEGEIREVERAIAAMDDQFRQPAPDGGRLLHAMAGKTCREIGVVVTRQPPDDGVMIENVEIVVSRPGAYEFEFLEGGDARGER